MIVIIHLKLIVSSVVWLTARPLQGAEIMDAGIGVATDDFTIGSACRYLVEEMNLHHNFISIFVKFVTLYPTQQSLTQTHASESTS